MFPADALDPDIAAMRAAESDAARAAVLVSVPVSSLMRWRVEFLRLCRRAAFAEGEAYVGALADSLTRRRHRGVVSTMESEGAKTILLGVIEREQRPRAAEIQGASPSEGPSAGQPPAGGETAGRTEQ